MQLLVLNEIMFFMYYLNVFCKNTRIPSLSVFMFSWHYFVYADVNKDDFNNRDYLCKPDLDKTQSKPWLRYVQIVHVQKTVSQEFVYKIFEDTVRCKINLLFF